MVQQVVSGNQQTPAAAQYILTAPPFAENLVSLDINALLFFIIKFEEYRADYGINVALWRHISEAIRNIIETRFVKDFAHMSFASFTPEILFEFIRKIVQPTR